MKKRVKRHAVVQPQDASYRLIPLTRNQNAIVDAADFEWLSRWNWYAVLHDSSERFYAARSEGGNHLYMHQVILGYGANGRGDHQNHDTLDNRRQNLRMATNQQNGWNQKKPLDNTSGFKGVSWHKQTNKWESGIVVSRKRIYLGLFHDLRAAARAYDDAAKKYYGEFAVLNFPDKSLQLEAP